MRYPMTLPRRISIFSLILLISAICDQLTKAWALENLEETSATTVIPGVLSLQVVYNPGAAFSFLTNATWIFTAISIAALAGILYMVIRGTNVFTLVMLGLLAGGAAGNLYDRLLRPPAFGVGHVIDFINYGGYFVGNVADIWIVLAAIGLCIAALRTPENLTQPSSTASGQDLPESAAASLGGGQNGDNQ